MNQVVLEQYRGLISPHYMLYTYIDQDEMVNKINFVLEFAFKSARSQKITVYSRSARRSNGNSKYKQFTLHELKFSVKWLIENSYFKLGNLVLRQCIGMSAATNLANIYSFAQGFSCPCSHIRDFGLLLMQKV